MRIETLWQALEGEIAKSGANNSGWLLRLAIPSSRCPLSAAVEIETNRRALLVKFPTSLLPPRHRWPQCKGLSSLVINISGEEYSGLILKDERYKDVFCSLAEDLLRRVSEVDEPQDQAKAFLIQLTRWQKFLSASGEGLNAFEIRGLWGELHFLREYLIPCLGTDLMTCWKGPKRLAQDFQLPNGAIEVKTTITTQPQSIRINGERQLDWTKWNNLLLCVFVLEERDSECESLPFLISLIRGKLPPNTEPREYFEDILLAAGYRDSDGQMYEEHRFLIRSELIFRLASGFPSLIEGDLPAGVGEVSYDLSLSACENYRLSPSETKILLKQLANNPKN